MGHKDLQPRSFDPAHQFQLKTKFHESREQLDEWLDGRRDVDLASDRHPVGGAFGCRDQQAFEKIDIQNSGLKN
jgi:hypothetical protein